MSASAPETTTAKPAKGIRLDLKTVGPLLALALLVLLGIALNENFLTYNNITNVLARSSFIGIIAIGATFVITSGGLDLSVGSMAAVIAGVMIIVMNSLIPSMGIGWGVIAIGMIALGTFAATFGGISGYTVAIDFGGRRVATIFSIMNMCGNIGAAIFPYVVGRLLTGTAGVPGSAGDWNMVIYLFAGILAIDAVIWAILNPKGTLFRD